MKKGDLLILLIIILMLGLMLSPWTSETFNSLSRHYPYYIGFLKFAILATIGEVLAGRIKAQRYTCPTYLWVRIVIWGIVGILIVFNFGLYEAGIRGIIARGLLPDIFPYLFRHESDIRPGLHGRPPYQRYISGE